MVVHSFGFIVHPLTSFQQRLFGVRTLNLGLAIGRLDGAMSPRKIAHLNLRETVPSLTGSIVSLPHLPDDLLANQSQTVSDLVKASEVCAQHGAEVVGLGGVAAMVGGQGKALAREVSLPVTSGNHLTAETAFQTLLKVLDLLPATSGPIGLVGLPSPVGHLLLEMMSYHGIETVVIAKSLPSPLKRLMENLRATTGTGIGHEECIDKAATRVLIAASSTGARIPISQLPAKSVVIDVAAPADILIDAVRDDVCIIDGEYLSPPHALRGDVWRQIYCWVTRQPNVLFACFAEPMLITLARRFDLCGVGRKLSIQKARDLGELAAGHGFVLDGFYRHGEMMSTDRIERCLR